MSGWAERRGVFVATGWLLVLIPLVAFGNPAMLTEPYGAFTKDACLIASALAVWIIAPMEAVEKSRG
jgi:hypothetical protein